MGIGISFFGGGGGGGGIARVADAAARLALTPTNGLIVIQLDTDELWEYDLTTVAWRIIGGISPSFVNVKFIEAGGGTDTITVAAPALASSWNMTLPPDVGTVDYVLRTDGNGVTTWAQINLAAAVTGVLPLANGGTSKNLTAANGGIVWTDADSMEILAAGTAGQLLQSGGAATPNWTTAVFPIGAITSPAVMVANTNNTWTAVSGAVGARFLRTSGATISFQQVILTSDVTGILPLANGGTAKNMTAVAGGLVWTDADSMEVGVAGTAGQAAISGGTGAPTWFAPTATNVLFAGTGGILAQDAGFFTWDSTNHRLFVGAGGITVPRDNIHIDNGNGVAGGIRFSAGTTTGTGTADGCSIGILTTGVFQLAQIENLDMVFRTANTQRVIIKNTGSTQINVAAIATNATDGFLYISTSAGTPTGVPSTLTGTAPIHVDTTNNLFYYYTNSQWRTAGGYVVQNTRQTGLSMSVGTTITPAIGADTTCFVVGNGGAITITAGTPIVTTSMQIGQVLKIVGTSDTNTVTFDPGNNLAINGSCTLGKDQTLTLFYGGTDGTNAAWVEQSRS